MGLFSRAPSQETWEILTKSLDVIAPWTYPVLKRSQDGDLFLFYRGSPDSGRIITYSRKKWQWLATDLDDKGHPVPNGFSTPELLTEGSSPIQYVGECLLMLCIGGLEGYIMASERAAMTGPPAPYEAWARKRLEELHTKGLY